MNKGDLIEAVASELKLNKIEASKAVEAVLANITKGVKTDQKVNLAGFGTFVRRTRAARTVTNPQTRQPIQVGESVTCAFKASSTLKESL